MWKNLKSYFIVEDEAPRKAQRKPVATKSGGAPAPAPPPSGTDPAPAAAPTGTTGEVNDRFVKVLLEAMEAANKPGFDYLEYKKALQNLKKMNFTDAVRFQTAYATAQSMGVTPQALLDSAQHYLGALQKEERKFGEALKGQRSQQVSDKEQQLEELERNIQQQEARIKELEEDIAKTRAVQKKLRTSIDKSTGKLQKTAADFERTYTVITSGIQEDIRNMQEFLK